ncbi:hypothetical protein [Halpernia sp. GG3]
MSTNNTHSQNFNDLRLAKDTFFQNQKKTIFNYLHLNTATASMVSIATGIPQKSICRYKRDLEKRGLIYEIEKKHCKETGFTAWYLTTNKELFPKVKPIKKF